MNFRLISIVALMGAHCVAASRAQLTRNLLANPGAETGDLTGWTQSGAAGHIADDGSYEEGFIDGYGPWSGSYQFVAGANAGASGSLSQSVSLLSLSSARLALIDAVNVSAETSVWHRSVYQGGTTDNVKIRLSFLDGANLPLGGFESPALDATTLSYYSAMPSVPAGSRTIAYSVDSYRGANGGQWIDAFTDDHSLLLVVPEASEWRAIAAAGLLAFAAAPRRVLRKITR